MTKCKTRLIVTTEKAIERLERVAAEVSKQTNLQVSCVSVSEFMAGMMVFTNY